MVDLARLRPELVQPQIESVETGIVDRVNPFGSIRFHRHKVAIQQRFEVLRHGGAADGQALRQIIDGFGGTPQLFQQIAAIGVGNCCERIG